MFAYCGNNPVTRVDTGGCFWDTVFDVVSLCFSIADVVENPDDPVAWVGLAADVASLVIPCVSGGGALVRAATKADDVVDAVKLADNTADAIKGAGNIGSAVGSISNATKKGWQVGDNVANLTKAGKQPSWSTVRQRYWKNQAHYYPEMYPNDLDRLKKGLAPIGDDGFSMELHHPYGRDGDNFFMFEPLTRTEHRRWHYGR